MHAGARRNMESPSLQESIEMLLQRRPELNEIYRQDGVSGGVLVGPGLTSALKQLALAVASISSIDGRPIERSGAMVLLHVAINWLLAGE